MRKQTFLALAVLCLAGCASGRSGEPARMTEASVGGSLYPVSLLQPLRHNDGRLLPSGTVSDDFRRGFSLASVTTVTVPECRALIEGTAQATGSPHIAILRESDREQCGLGYWITNAAPARTSVFRNDYPLESLPAALIQPLFDIQGAKACNPAETIAECATLHKDVKMNRKHGPLRVRYNDFETSINRAAFGDFDGDGRDDMLLELRTYQPSGLKRMFTMVCVSQNGPRGVALNPGCIYK